MSEDDLLSQIKDLLGQYLALGSQTPVAGPAQDLLTAIDSSTGSADAGQGALDDPTVGAADAGAPPADDMSMDYSSDPTPKAKSFGEATSGAMNDLMRRNKKSAV